MEYEAECCVWFKVRFTDNGKDVLEDQAHDALLDFIDIPMGRLDDAEVHSVSEIKP